ncbi:4476_t:CDS:2, partial [Racocetra fulgida]
TFSGHRSCESLADYCQLSEDQHITNTALLIPFSLYKLNLDEYNNYEDISVNQEYQEDQTEIKTQSLTEIDKQGPTEIKKQGPMEIEKQGPITNENQGLKN